jgi:FMN phosphatase YigB (HAD superfamily)
MKKFTLLLLAQFFVAGIFGQIYYPINYQQLAENHKSADVNIAFDVDGVLVDGPKLASEFMHLIVAAENKLALAGVLIWCIQHRAEIREKQHNANGFAIIDWIAQHCPRLTQATNQSDAKPLKERVKEIVAGGTAKADVIAILTGLKEKKYGISIATNREQASARFLINKGILPNEDNLYNLIFTPDYPELEKTGNFETDTLLHGTLAKKPSQKYFENLREVLQKKVSNEVSTIFIDDQLKNVKAAADSGITSIHFQNAEQLKQDLTTLGIHVNN